MMKHAGWLRALCVVGLMAALPLVAAKPRIAVLSTGHQHADEFDAALKTLGLTADRYDPELKDFYAKLPSYDLLLVAPLFTPKADVDAAAFKKWLGAGGMIATSQHDLGFLAKKDSDFDAGAWGNCNSSQWEVKGWSKDADPPHPLNFFPNALKKPNSWPHYKKWSLKRSSAWEVVSRCSEGYPETFARRFGKGLVYVTALREGSTAELENWLANLALARAGLKLKDFSMTPAAVGPGKLSMTFAAAPAEPVTIAYEAAARDGSDVQRFEAKVEGTACELPFHISLRGPATIRLSANGNTLFERPVVLPRELNIAPRAERGILSTVRRLPDVRFAVLLAPDTDEIDGDRLTVDVMDAAGRTVGSAACGVAATNLDFDIAVPMDRSLPAGVYTAKARLARGFFKKDYTAGTSLTLLAPREAQALIDEDNTFLVAGKPFFPLGIYHAAPDQYPRLKEIGLNTVHFWTWYGKKGMDAARAAGLRVLFEMNWKGPQVCRDNVKAYGDHPAMLMWYILDEPTENSEGQALELRDAYHAADTNHPTYLASCRPDLFGLQSGWCDVFAHDPYGGPQNCADWMAKAAMATCGRKPIVCVPPSFGGESNGVLRVTAYLAVAHDARGIIWYPWCQVGGGPVGIGLKNHPQEQEELKRIVSELTTLTPALVATDRRPFVQGDIHAILCTVGKERTLILANGVAKETVAELVLPELAGVAEVAGVFDGAKVPVKDGKLPLKLEPYGTRAFRW